ncbi:MAG: hypothetical protein HY709_05440 [Candidatus Latescibacteria bacterium]|nr:hypothetical protein [Candidatus Latescibacterota bacterium]
MLPSMKGIHQNGKVILKEPPPPGVTTTEVVVTFLLPQSAETPVGEGTQDWQEAWKKISCWDAEDLSEIQKIREKFER